MMSVSRNSVSVQEILRKFEPCVKSPKPIIPVRKAPEPEVKEDVIQIDTNTNSEKSAPISTVSSMTKLFQGPNGVGGNSGNAAAVTNSAVPGERMLVSAGGYGRLFPSKRGEVNHVTPRNNNNNKVGQGSLPPRKPPRTFAHDIYMQRKASLDSRWDPPKCPKGRVNDKPDPPPKPFTQQTSSCVGNVRRGPPATWSGKKSGSQVAVLPCSKTPQAPKLARPKTPPPPRPHASPPQPYAVTAALFPGTSTTALENGRLHSRLAYPTHTVPRASRVAASLRRSVSEEHVYDEPEARSQSRVTSGKSPEAPMKFVDNEIYGFEKVDYTEPYGAISGDKVPRLPPHEPLHYMSSPLCLQQIHPTAEVSAVKSRVTESANEKPEPSSNVKDEPLKRGIGLMRDVVTWSLSCVSQQGSPSLKH